MQSSKLPAATGVGFKPEHFADILGVAATLGFLEVHAENYMGAGGPPHAMLERLRQDHALSIHGVGLSIGGAGDLDRAHLRRLARLCDRYQPAAFSEHLAWSSHDGAFLNDLLPLPYDDATLSIICRHVDQVQETLDRQMLLENPASYLSFDASTFAETQFLAEVAGRTGCGLLLDVNNVFVSAVNLGTSAIRYVDAFPVAHVGEIHLAGHTPDGASSDAALLIDSHAEPVADAVWRLYRRVLDRTGPVATLIERDANLPPFSVLLAEAGQAARMMAAVASFSRMLEEAVDAVAV